MTKCHHKWVERLDGYEEQCIAAICIKCGEYGCGCNAGYGKMSKEERAEFTAQGINGNNHEIERNREAKHAKTKASKNL